MFSSFGCFFLLCFAFFFFRSLDSTVHTLYTDKPSQVTTAETNTNNNKRNNNALSKPFHSLLSVSRCVRKQCREGFFFLFGGRGEIPWLARRGGYRTVLPFARQLFSFCVCVCVRRLLFNVWCNCVRSPVCVCVCDAPSLTVSILFFCRFCFCFAFRQQQSLYL